MSNRWNSNLNSVLFAMKRRMRLLLVRIARFSSPAILFLCLWFFAGRRKSPLPSSLQFLSGIGAILDDAVSISLLHEQSIGSSRDGISTPLDSNSTSLLKTRATQDSLACFIEEGIWEHETIPGPARSPRALRLSKLPLYAPRNSCFPSHITPGETSRTAKLCSFLRAKKISLVGPETTFHLHSIWLRALEKHENRSFNCLGPEFCTFHHICQPPSNGTETVQSPRERFKKLPREQDLTASGSAILRYVLSTSLHVSSNPKDPAYTLPLVDPLTGVRIRNMYWLNQARKADVVVINRGPVPAPAWSYGGLEGNWSFINGLPPNQSHLCLDSDTICHESQAHRIVKAALHVTLTTFLPSIIHTLHTLHMDLMIRQKVIVWHGSWYIQPHCSNPASAKPVRSVEDLLQLLAYAVVDPWSIYYNAQGH